MKQKLTKTERLQLANQFTILNALTKDESYAIKAEIAERGYEGLYDDLFESIFDGVSVDVCEETGAILHMYGVINNSYASLSDEDKKLINLNKIKFEGFDGNNDDHYGYMSFLVKRMELWDEYQGKSLNSHTRSSIGKYRKMLQVYNNLGGDSHYDYTVGDLKLFEEAL